MTEQFRLRVEITIEKLPDGRARAGERLSTREEFDIPAASFTEVAAVLGKFHDLADKVRQPGPDGDDCSFFKAHGEHHSACCPTGRKRAGR